MFKCIVRVCCVVSFSTSGSIDVKRYVNQILQCTYFTNRLHDMPDLDKKISYNTVKVQLSKQPSPVCGQSDDKKDRGV